MQFNENSLTETVDYLNDSFFWGKEIPQQEKSAVAHWLATRQGMEGSYAGMFAPCPIDYKNPLLMFTGEKITSGAGTGHILGEETCRALLKLDVKDDIVVDALKRATDLFLNRLNGYMAEDNNQYGSYGWYCCGTCTPAFWRHLSAGGLEKQEQHLVNGMRILKHHRDDKGGWRRFPFYWTLSALIEIDSSLVKDEIRYLEPKLERLTKRLKTYNTITQRRRAVVERALEMI